MAHHAPPAAAPTPAPNSSSKQKCTTSASARPRPRPSPAGPTRHCVHLRAGILVELAIVILVIAAGASHISTATVSLLASASACTDPATSTEASCSASSSPLVEEPGACAGAWTDKCTSGTHSMHHRSETTNDDAAATNGGATATRDVHAEIVIIRDAKNPHNNNIQLPSTYVRERLPKLYTRMPVPHDGQSGGVIVPAYGSCLGRMLDMTASFGLPPGVDSMTLDALKTCRLLAQNLGARYKLPAAAETDAPEFDPACESSPPAEAELAADGYASVADLLTDELNSRVSPGRSARSPFLDISDTGKIVRRTGANDRHVPVVVGQRPVMSGDRCARSVYIRRSAHGYFMFGVRLSTARPPNAYPGQTKDPGFAIYGANGNLYEAGGSRSMGKSFAEGSTLTAVISRRDVDPKLATVRFLVNGHPYSPPMTLVLPTEATGVEVVATMYNTGDEFEVVRVSLSEADAQLQLAL